MCDKNGASAPQGAEMLKNGSLAVFVILSVETKKLRLKKRPAKVMEVPRIQAHIHEEISKLVSWQTDTLSQKLGLTQ